MKIIEIRNTRDGEVAYIFDEETGRVKKVFVDDYTSSEKPYHEEETFDEEPPRRRVVNNKTLRRAPVRTVEYETDETEEDIEDRTKIQERPSIIPPHLAGVFVPADSPGAAQEIRRI
jgi:hypothetical protein